MKRSENRILTTHTGSLARPKLLGQLLVAREQGTQVVEEEFDSTLRDAVREIVSHQVSTGLDIINDGEQGKVGFAPYVRDRLAGFEGMEEPRPLSLDARDFPEFTGRLPKLSVRPACNQPIAWRDFSSVERDLRNLSEAAESFPDREVFMTAASPGTIGNFYPNRYYRSRDEYLFAIADVMQREYEAIVDAGFILQLDAPDLALRSVWFPDLSVDEFRGVIQLNLEALNHAVRNIDPDRMRLHICWGATEAPHIHDTPLEAIIDILLTARPGGLCVAGANGRHEHEWRIWEHVKLPDDKILIPGVIDSTTNIIEHPQAVADRIVRYCSKVGKERVIAGVDCGFATYALSDQVDSRIAWAKLEALREGAEIASSQLWQQRDEHAPK